MESTLLFDSPLVPSIRARPLYFLLQHALFAVLPESTFALRILPLLFGLAGVVVTWVAARRLFGPVAAAAAASLAAISPWHLYASGFARYYALVYLLAVASYLSLVLAYDTDRPGAYVRALLCLALGSMTHPSFLFPMAGFVLGLSLVRRDGRLGWHWPTTAAWRFLWGPFGGFLLAAFVALRLSGGAGGALRNWGGRGAVATLRLVPAMVEWMTPTMFAVGALGVLLVVLSPGLGASQRRWGVASLTGGAGAIALLVVASAVTNVYADYGLASLPLVLVSGGGLVQLAADRSTVRAWVLGFIATAVLAVGVLASTMSFLSDGTRFDYRPAYARITQEPRRLPVLTWPIALQRYYAPQLSANELVPDRAVLNASLEQAGELWAVVSVQRYGIVLDSQHVLAVWLSEKCRLVDAYERPRFDYRRYRVELYRCQSGTTE